MIRQCNDTDFEIIYSIINDAARVYKGVIPEDRWKECTSNDRWLAPEEYHITDKVDQILDSLE